MNKQLPGKVVALDIGGVCLHLRPGLSARILGYDSMEEVMLSSPAIGASIRAVETGQIDENEYLARLLGDIPRARTREQVQSAWQELLGAEVEGMAELVAEMVGAGFKVIFLSDISRFHYRQVLSTLSFAPLVHSAVVSYEVGAMKPEAAMYEAFEQRCGNQLPALYLDDRECNIEAARGRGWNAHHFTGIDGAVKAFAEVRRL